MLHCPGCNHIIMMQTKDGYKVRSRMVLFSGDSGQCAEAICPTCKRHVPVPLSLGNVEEIPELPKIIIKS